jgi:uncharacterized integral membrane protein
MTTAARTAIRAAALAGPVVLAFAEGGHDYRPRLIALIAAGVLLGLWALVGPGPLPRDRRALLAIGALGGYAAWVAISAGWAPLGDVARADLERALLYAAALALGATLWRCRRAARAVEPALAAGALIVCGYGLLGRLLPSVVSLEDSRLAGARLFQPLGYWNAEGTLAALGLLLCVRLIGDRTRPRPVRLLAAAASVPLGVVLYLTFSRGALVAFAAGAVILLAVAPTWSQLRGLAIGVEPAGFAIAICAALPAVNDLSGDRDTEGALALAGILALMIVAAALAAWASRVEDEETVRLGRLPLPPRAPLIAAVLAVALVVVPLVAGDSDRAPGFGETSSRIVSTGSNRYEYWDVALRSFADHPLAGVGTGGFAVEWRRERTLDEVVQDAHSLYLETGAELGLVGLALLLAAWLGVALAARAALREDPVLVAGPVAVLAAWALHAGIDWDWEMPALTLFAVTLAGLLLSQARGRSAG